MAVLGLCTVAGAVKFAGGTGEPNDGGIGSGDDARGGLNSLATARMRTAEASRNFGWDFESVWSICQGRDYPRLRWEGIKCGAGRGRERVLLLRRGCGSTI